MRNTLRLFVDCLLVGLASGIAVMALLVALDVGGMQVLLARAWLGGPALLMVAVFSGMVITSLRFGWQLVRQDIRDDHLDTLRRKLLIPAQRRPRR